MVDEDGTLTGGAPDSKVVAGSEIYNPSECTEDPKFSGNVQGAVCSPNVRLARFELRNVHPSALATKIMKFITSFGTSTVPYSGQGAGDLQGGWMALLPTAMTTTLQADITIVTDITYEGTVEDLEVRNYLQTLFAL